ncbi:alpha/beta hydrolase [Hahella sp. KA22]|uniref:patatin-like phospholipase family protein n=1 Tax=Hahella sp. KA22 TaxID=1628392 RepID=UPI000FDD1C58|nr:patatin-like phospholipase family protein [Hahella sp. KA22]AZZ91703.1 alpha/beta hydrolase [Hahella sp. KA22]QAY55073.1 alpha/beta hydrolase [Hahella sp. KA22]
MAAKTVALVLGSGGARGYAHVGVIEVLLERGYNIVALSGCSMGALVGGIYAAGKLREFKDWATGLDQFDVLRLLDISLSSPGAIRGEKVFSVVRELIGDIRIEDLPIAYTAVATDLLHQKEVWFQEGPLHQAIRASVAIPSLLTPEIIKDRVLVDGGLLNPLPIIPTISAHADYIIAVNLSYYDYQAEKKLYEKTEIKQDRRFEEWVAGVWEKASQFFDREEEALSDAKASPPDAPSIGEPTPNSAGGAEAVSTEDEASTDDAMETRLSLGKFDIMNLSFEAMQSSLTQYKLAGYPPDILINIPKGVCRTFEYHKAPELIQLGREIAERTLDKLAKEGKLEGNGVESG